MFRTPTMEVRLRSHSVTSESDRSSVSGRSTTSRASKSSRRGPKKPVATPPPSEPTEDPKTPFSPNMLAGGLSQLGRTADGRAAAYLTLTLTGTDLGNAEALAAFPHLQAVRLPDNRLTDVRGLGVLRNLTAVDVSGNKLTQVLDLRLGADGSGPTNLRSADFSRNSIDLLRDLRPFSRLTSLALAHNRIERVGAGLRPLTLLKVLDLSHNRLVSCRGLEELASLRELRLSHNCLASLEPLAGLSQLQVLTADHNWLTHLSGLASLAALRTLDVSYNRLGRLEELAAVRKASLLGGLDVRGNPLDKALSLRLHVVHLLPQVVLLDGVPVDSKEKVLAANMHAADAEGLRLIRRKYFPNGELDDGGGAIPPLAAGLVASAAEEEQAMDGSDSSALLRIDAWAASIKPESLLAAGALSSGARSVGSLGGTPGAGTGTGAALVALADQLASVCVPVGGSTGPAAVAAAAATPAAPAASGPHITGVGSGSMKAAPPPPPPGPNPMAQLQRARVCWRWVVTHVAPGASLDRTWDVDAPLFGPGPAAAAVERLLLGGGPPPPPRSPSTPSSMPSSAVVGSGGGASAVRPPATAPPPAPPGAGTWAERVARLFTLLCRACELDAVPIPGYWKHPRLPPGERVHSHNHCWAGVKVNGRWRLVDPAAAALDGGHFPFFVPPDAWIYSYWPLEAAWQLLQDPLGHEVWWALPYASVAFFAGGCCLGNPDLAAVNELPAVREGGVLPAFQFNLAAPRTPGCHLAQRLYRVGSRRLVAEWPPKEPGVPAYAFQQDVDGLVTRREILAAFRRNRQHADVLKCPARIRQDDGTFDKFVEVFMQIDSSKLGTFSFNELASYMGVLPSGMYESSEDEDGEYGSSDEGGEEDGDEGEEEGEGGGEE
ncbi:hypothetical protein GPECTOR_28g785 [Gonium pectorale]|uniref:Transglutaminase-like domain-containing protein n=1 Tax=Gonium pectorale TaxID=33097 RepID=A0A150GEY5_GONPE|nr:hypothetical protein GPECTOR_28g785 [Gonium pectorale]|eukprot:KXZ48378.1 hypothetical protein GPECTOR_28g785 [Gonium pectorale]